MTLTEIDARIEYLEQALAQPAHYPTEIYTRIVGYYRSLANWNAGKREEYDHRQTFRASPQRVAQVLPTTPSQALAPASQNPGEPASHYLLFTKPQCPNCPAMKTKAAGLTLAGTSFDVNTESGFQAAVEWTITATPTLILLDAQGREQTRITDAGQWGQLAGWLESGLGARPEQGLNLR